MRARRVADADEFLAGPDLANPTSNAIYARIGYEPVADWDQWSFQPLE
jgi:hypothetical protein